MSLKMKYRSLGVMSGTSLDGIDLAICTLIKDPFWQFKINKAETIKYPIYLFSSKNLDSIRNY